MQTTKKYKNRVVCLECGNYYKQLSWWHLKKHNLSSLSYRRKYGLQRNDMICKSKALKSIKRAYQTIKENPRFGKPWQDITTEEISEEMKRRSLLGWKYPTKIRVRKMLKNLNRTGKPSHNKGKKLINNHYEKI